MQRDSISITKKLLENIKTKLKHPMLQLIQDRGLLCTAMYLYDWLRGAITHMYLQGGQPSL